MNDKEKEQRRIMLAMCGGRCEVCGKELSFTSWQGAHRIANTIENRKRWGDMIIDHPLNIAIVCSLSCNQECNIGHNPGECWELVARIAKKEKERYICEKA